MISQILAVPDNFNFVGEINDFDADYTTPIYCIARRNKNVECYYPSAFLSLDNDSGIVQFGIEQETED